MASGRRSSTARALRGALWVMAAWHVFEAVSLRKRREAVRRLGRPAGAGAHGKVDVLAVAGTQIDDESRGALREEMDTAGLGVIDVIPEDLPPDRWLRVLRRLDTATIGDDVMKHPGGANEAVALHPSVAQRMGVGGDETPDRGTLARLITKAQRHSAGRHALRIVPGVHAAPLTGEERWRELEGITTFAWPYGAWAPIITTLESAHLFAMTAGAVVAPVPALAALATWAIEPMLALAPVGDDETHTPSELAEATLSRLPKAIALNLATITAGYQATQARNAERAATPLPRELTHDEQFEPRRDTCPWCESSSLARHHDAPDLLLHKPGTYYLDQCQDCGHIFQNPRLTIAGLEYIYDNAYEGTGSELAEVSFAAIADAYHSKVESLARFSTPASILDIGSAHGHFLLAARQRWPHVECHALDMSDNVEEANRRGWNDKAYIGLFPEVADSIDRTYDAVTMHHFLEHVRDPRAELAAAAKVLEPGGHLMVEVPDPEYDFAKYLGRYWYQWGQPEHLQLMPSRNLARAIEEAGFEVLSVEHVTLRGDVLNSLGLALQHAARSPHLPWLADPGLAHRLKRIAVYTAALPLLAIAKVVDLVRDREFQETGKLSTDQPHQSYRIVARRI